MNSMMDPSVQFYPSIEFSNLKIKVLISDKLYEVVDGLTGASYALKEFDSNYNSSDRAKLSREVEMIKNLDHPNLVKCLKMFDMGDRIYLLLEHMSCGPLTSVDIKSELDIARIAHQVLSCLSYLHRNKISHGDIKPSNFFFSSKEQVKVLYLGKILSKALVMSEIGEIHDAFSWDVWNVGLSILKLCKGLSHNLGKPVQKPSKELLSFLVCCMKTNLSERWTAEELTESLETYFPIRRTTQQLVPVVMQSSKLNDMPRSTLTRQSSVLNDASFMSTSSDITTLNYDSDMSQLDFVESSSDYDWIMFPKETLVDEEWQISRKKRKLENSMEYKDKPEGVRRKFRCCVLAICFFSILKKRPSGHLEPPGTPDYHGRCIQHCSLLLPECEFEKAKLVQLWIAEECIEEQVTSRIEDVANSYFDNLVNEEVIISSKFDNFYGHLKYKVNTSKFPDRLLKQGNYLRIDEGNLDEIYGEALHLTWQCKRLDQTLFDALKNLKQLRTLLVHNDCGMSIKKLPNDIFLGLKLLKTLDLSCTHISELPGSIGTVKSLRFLDISETPVKRLPESTDRLCFLQTLRLRGCIGLSALPRGMRSLINLRHLDLDIVGQLKSMPRGMGNLTKLQTLQAFLVGKNDGCCIGELKNMNDITGSFCISRLENVANAEEAKGAALTDKQYIDKLELRWHDHDNDMSQDTTEILECLQPHFHLKELQITNFSGSKLPSWISNPSFTDLASITLYKCINCLILPCIGNLPALKILHIVETKNVKDIRTLLYRTDENRVFNAFPKLEKLTLDNMLSLERWTGIEDGDFPCLRHISIRYCQKLAVLPSLSSICSLQHLEVICCLQLISLPEGLLPSSLESLIIRECPKLNARCLEDGGEDRYKISHVKNIWMDFQKISLE